MSAIAAARIAASYTPSQYLAGRALQAVGSGIDKMESAVVNTIGLGVNLAVDAVAETAKLGVSAAGSIIDCWV